jgi:hypothetical protein
VQRVNVLNVELECEADRWAGHDAAILSGGGDGFGDAREVGVAPRIGRFRNYS